MTKFHGAIGFAHAVEEPAGAYKEVITEKTFFGDEVRSVRRQAEGENLNPELSSGASLSVVMDTYLSENIFAIRYAVWRGHPWKVVEVTTKGPRAILRLGGVYRGRRPPS